MSQSGKAAVPAAEQRQLPSDLPSAQQLELCAGGELKPPVETGRLVMPIAIEEMLLAILMALVGGITLLNVLTRYLTNISFAFTEEYSVLLLFILVFVGISSAIVKNGHMKVTFFTDMLSPPWRRRFEIAGLVSMAICFAVLIVYGTRIAYDSYEIDETSPGLGNPMWVYYATLPALSFWALLRVLGAAMRQIRPGEGESR